MCYFTAPISVYQISTCSSVHHLPVYFSENQPFFNVLRVWWALLGSPYSIMNMYTSHCFGISYSKRPSVCHRSRVHGYDIEPYLSQVEKILSPLLVGVKIGGVSVVRNSVSFKKSKCTFF